MPNREGAVIFLRVNVINASIYQKILSQISKLDATVYKNKQTFLLINELKLYADFYRNGNENRVKIFIFFELNLQ